MNLPPAAAAMYNTWWSFVAGIANERNDQGGYAYNIAQAQSIAAQVFPDYEGTVAPYNPIGLSQLFGAARRIQNAVVDVATADPSTVSTGFQVAAAPWGRPPDEQAASPKWQARAEFTYTDETGQQLSETMTVIFNQTLPPTFESLQLQTGFLIQNNLSSPPGTGTPRSGVLDSVDTITLIAVLSGRGRPGPLPAASGPDVHAGGLHLRRRRNQAAHRRIGRGPHTAALGGAQGLAA